MSSQKFFLEASRNNDLSEVMTIKIGSPLAIALCAFGLSGCFAFERLPFSQSELKPFSETLFAAELIELAQQDVPEEARQMLEETFDDTSDDLTYTVSENLILLFEKQEMGWYPNVLMKNESHYLACKMLVDDDMAAPPGIVLTPPKKDNEEINLKELAPEETTSEDMFLPTIVSGTDAAMKDFLLELSSSSLKACLAIPFEFLNGPPPIYE